MRVTVAALLTFILVMFTVGCALHGKGATSLDDLKNGRIDVLTGSAGELAAVARFPGASIREMTSSADSALAVKTLKADAFIHDRSLLLQLVKKNPDLVILDEPLGKLSLAVAINRGNSALLFRINGLFADLEKDGTLRRLREKWIEPGYSAIPELFPSGGAKADGVLKMGTCATQEPFSFQANGAFTGMDIELSRLIGDRLKKKIQIFDMPFESLIPALETGKIDFALSNFSVTEERKKRIAFSTPYIESDICALVRQAGGGTAGNGMRGFWPTAFVAGFAQSFHDNIMKENRYLLIWDGLKTTVCISVLATLLGTLLGGLVCFMRMSKNRLLNLPARIYISILRGTPVLVLMMLIFYVVFASVDIRPALVAIIAFGLNFAAYAAEIFRTGIAGVDRGQTEAGIAMGFTRVETFFYIVMPQALQRILPVFKGEFITLVKMTSIVGYIAVHDLTKASDIIRSRTFDAFFPLVMVAVLYFLISWALMQALEYLERRTDPMQKRRKTAGAA
jgi:polar amino acid transport system substrate-binding protein